MAFLRRSTPVPPDDHSERVPPDPMPNSAVKPLSADGSVGPPHARVGHRQAFLPNPGLLVGVLSFGGLPWRAAERRPAEGRPGSRQAFLPKIPSTKVLGIFSWAGAAPLFTWWGRFAGRPLAGSRRSTALVAVPRRAGRSHPHARVAEGRPEHRQARIPETPVGPGQRGFFRGRVARGVGQGSENFSASNSRE